MFRYGMLPAPPETYGGRLYGVKIFWSSGLSSSSGWRARSVVSTPVNARWSLVKLAPWKVRVAVSGKTSSLDEVVVPSPDQVPNRDRATTTGHRSAAQKGQYSAPT